MQTVAEKYPKSNSIFVIFYGQKRIIGTIQACSNITLYFSYREIYETQFFLKHWSLSKITKNIIDNRGTILKSMFNDWTFNFWKFDDPNASYLMKIILLTDQIPVWSNIHRVPTKGVFRWPHCIALVMLAGEYDVPGTNMRL